MLIDWFTVGAQALNFVILVWLLKRFLYKPILDAIEARETRIAKELADADAKETEAKKARDEFQHKSDEFDRQRAALLRKATADADAAGKRLIDEAHQAADALLAKRQETLRNDAHNLSLAISRRTQQEVFAITRKALMDLTTTSLEERLVDVFTRRLREMDGRAKEALGEALKAASVPGLVRSAFDLPGEQRAVIQKALNETFSADIHVRFETAPNLIGGIELTTNGQKVAWSIADYLGSLEKSVGELLQEREKAASKAEPKPDAKVAPQPEANVDAHAEAKGESAPEAKAAPQPEAKAALNPAVNVPLKPDAKADSVPETKAAPKPEAKVDAQAEAKGESTPEATIGLIPGAKTEPKSEAKTEPVPGAKAGTNPEAPKPEAKG